MIDQLLKFEWAFDDLQDTHLNTFLAFIHRLCMSSKDISITKTRKLKLLFYIQKHCEFSHTKLRLATLSKNGNQSKTERTEDVRSNNSQYSQLNLYNLC